MIHGIGPQQILFRAKELLTKSVFYPPTDIHSVDKAVKAKQDKTVISKNPKDLTGFQKFLSKIKVGHLVGLASFGLTAAFNFLKNKIPEDLRSILNTINITGPVTAAAAMLLPFFAKNIEEEGLKGKLDTFVDRYVVKADGSSTNLKENSKGNAFPDLGQVVLSETNDEELKQALSLVKDEGKGSVFCLRGITRCGKTMTAKAMARHLAQKSKTGKAQFWYASDKAMERNFTDYDKFLGELVGNLFGLEATVKRIERLIANAILEDDDVVIVLDEAHLMLGFEGKDVKHYDPHNPNQTSPVVEALKKLISEKLRTEKCKNVHVVMTANSSANSMAAPMRGRMDADLFYDKPRKRERKKLLELVIKDELEKKKDRIDLKAEDFTEQDFERLSEVGTCNLLERFGKEEKLAHEEAVRAGFGGKVEELRNRPMLHYELIEKVIRGSVVKYIEGKEKGKEKLIATIENSLKRRLEAELEQRPIWEGELAYYFGAGKRNNVIRIASKR